MHPIANIGTIAAALGGNLAVHHSRRPYIDDNGAVRVLVDNSGRSVVVNTPALLRYDEWKDIDRDVAKVAVERLVANGVLISRGLTYNLGSPGITESVSARAGSGSRGSRKPKGNRRSDVTAVDAGFHPEVVRELVGHTMALVREAALVLTGAMLRLDPIWISKVIKGALN